MPNKLYKEQVHFGDSVFPVRDFVVVLFLQSLLIWFLGFYNFTFYFPNASFKKINSFLVFQKIIEG